MYLTTASEMQAMDRMTIESFGIPGQVLMENAGRAAFRVLLDTFPDISGKRVGIMAGRGNNGGDGFVMARYLAQQGISVQVFLLTEKHAVQGDAAANLRLLYHIKVPVLEVPDMLALSSQRIALMHQQIWVDAILGTGLKSEVRGYYKEAIQLMNYSGKPIFAVDIPSGLNSDTGQHEGECIRAKATVTFACAKPGHFLYPGADYCGDLTVVDIGIPPFIGEHIKPRQHLLTWEYIAERIRLRASDAHKGRAGHLLILGGSSGKSGAAAMTAMAAMRAGAGLVTLAAPESINGILETLTLEAMTLPLPEEKNGAVGMSAFDIIMSQLPGKQCMALGPGLGTAPETKELMKQLIIKSPVPLIIDADGLNCLADAPKILKSIKVPVIITPHPGEMSRLNHSSIQDIQRNRIGSARSFAQEMGVYTVLKGAATVTACPDGTVYLNPTGNSGMASGGMGDVLTGIIAGLITQGYSCADAAGIGTFIHGYTADQLAEQIGPIGFLAGDIIHHFPRYIKDLISRQTAGRDDLPLSLHRKFRVQGAA